MAHFDATDDVLPRARRLSASDSDASSRYGWFDQSLFVQKFDDDE
jgi:hypothetical protein